MSGRRIALAAQSAVSVGRAAIRHAGPLVFLVFCTVAAAVWMQGAAAPPATGSGTARSLEARLAEGRERLAALVPVTAERPLFQPGRRPEAAPEAPPPAPPPALMLVGIIGDGDQRLALVRMSDSEELFRLDPGGRIARWEILSIGEATIAVSEDGGAPFELRIDG